MSEDTFEEFTEEDVEMAVELGELVREEDRAEASEFLGSILKGE